jgi:hypothetical protein
MAQVHPVLMCIELRQDFLSPRMGSSKITATSFIVASLVLFNLSTSNSNRDFSNVSVRQDGGGMNRPLIEDSLSSSL